MWFEVRILVLSLGFLVSLCLFPGIGAEAIPAQPESVAGVPIQDRAAGESEDPIEITPMTPQDLPVITLKGRMSSAVRILVLIDIEGQRVFCDKFVGQEGTLRSVRIADSLLQLRIDDWNDEEIIFWTEYKRGPQDIPQTTAHKVY